MLLVFRTCMLCRIRDICIFIPTATAIRTTIRWAATALDRESCLVATACSLLKNLKTPSI
jgi:hypothetical protein